VKDPNCPKCGNEMIWADPEHGILSDFYCKKCDKTLTELKRKQQLERWDLT